MTLETLFEISRASCIMVQRTKKDAQLTNNEWKISSTTDKNGSGGLGSISHSMK
jgi:hypothetical protein